MGNAHYVLDAKTSQLTVQAFAEGLAGIADHRPQFSVREFSAELEFDPDQLKGGSLRLRAKTASLEIMDEVSQRDRKAIERVTASAAECSLEILGVRPSHLTGAEGNQEFFLHARARG